VSKTDCRVRYTSTSNLSSVVYCEDCILNEKSYKFVLVKFLSFELVKSIYVYILQCADGTYYTGVTNNPDRRLAEHNTGVHKDSYTYSRRPVDMKYCAIFNDPELAISWEKKIKGWSHKKKEALIENNWDELCKLSKRYKIKSYKRK